MFIVFEGLDGSGKSSVLEKLKILLENKKVNFFLTKEPYGTNYGNFFKNIINESKFNNFSSLQFLLFQAERMIHLKEIILPELNKNKIVLSDRFLTSSLVYQGLNGKIDINLMIKIHDEFCKNEFKEKIYPNIIFYFYANNETLKERIKLKSNSDNFDENCLNNLEKFKEYYDIIFKKLNKNIKIFKINTSFNDIEATTNKIFKLIMKKIKIKN